VLPLKGTAIARNVEIKARVADREALLRRAQAIATEGPVEIAQDDTFFRCDNGRLKLRMFADDRGELIFYRRADTPGPKESFYLRSPTSAPATLRESLALAYGIAGRVRKTRTLYLVGRTRIHVDRVEGLGDFMELEVVLADGESVDAGMREAENLMAMLGIDASPLVTGAYVDFT
jgi:predicted adenylyl cyclase CyaB